MDIQITTIDTITVNDICELSQDSYYTRNPEDFGVEGDIGPWCPTTVFVSSIEIIQYEDKADGDIWYHAKVKHDGMWEIYTDTAVGPFIDLKVKEAGHKFSHVDFSEQGMQENKLMDLDLVA